MNSKKMIELPPSKLLSTIENIPLGLILITSEGVIELANSAAQQFIELPSGKTLGEKITEIWPSLNYPIQQCSANAQHSYGHQLELPEDNVVVDLMPLDHNDQKNGILLIVKPSAWISGKIVEEQKKRASINEELELILNSSFDGIWICSSGGVVRRINKASEKINNIRSKHVVGRKMDDLILEGVVDRSVTLAVIKSGKSETFVQHLHNGKKLLATGNPVFDKAGKLAWVVVNERDITELSQLQNELQESRKIIKDYQTEITFLSTQEHYFFPSTIRNEAMKRAFNMAMKVAKIDSTVLLQGESGVGKESLAKQIHNVSPRQEGPFIQVDCPLIPELLIGQELFGFENGNESGFSFQNQMGLLERANKGTLFLSEVDQLPLLIQAKLSRFIESREIQREGGIGLKKIDVRIIATSSQDLEEIVNKNEFHKDLFLQLNIISIGIPPLRKRIEDIPPLVELFLKQSNEKCSTTKVVEAKTMDHLSNYDFPGNIRELAHLIEQLVVHTPGNLIQIKDLPLHVQKKELPQDHSFIKSGLHLQEAVEILEKSMIQETLKIFSNQKHAAFSLGVNQSTLSRKIKKYNIVT